MLFLFIKIFLILFSIAIFIISEYAFLFLIFAMLPAIIAITIDKRINKYASSTICAFNLIGVMPFLFNLLRINDINSEAKNMITDSIIWFSIYGCTSLGWVLIWTLPKLTSWIFIARTRTKIKNIDEIQNKLIEEWGLRINKN